MTYIDKKILNKEVILWGSRLLSLGSQDFSFMPKRSSVETSGHGDPANTYGKGPWQAMASAKWSGLATDYASMAALADDTSGKALYPLTWPVADSTASPVCAPGAGCTFAATMTADLKETGARGALKTADVNWQGQSQVHVGQVLYTNLGAAALSASGTRTPGINLGALTAGHVLAGVIHVFSPTGAYPGAAFAGTGGPSYTAALKSGATGAFSSPVTRHTSPTFTVEGAEYFEIDGDVTPISDPWYEVVDTITGTGVALTVLIALAISAKPFSG